MKVVLQRVNHASVTKENMIPNRIKKGFLLLLGIEKGDNEKDIDMLAEKIVHLRIFGDENGKFHYSLIDTKGECLVVSQFTLLADCKKGRRPSFDKAELPEKAKPLCDRFIQTLRAKGVAMVKEGFFGAYMQVLLENDGPVTILLDSKTL